MILFIIAEVHTITGTMISLIGAGHDLLPDFMKDNRDYTSVKCLHNRMSLTELLYKHSWIKVKYSS